MTSSIADDTRWLDLTDQAALVRRGEVTAAELVQAAIERIEALDPALNSVIHRRFEQASKEAAGTLDGPFAGVPFLVKDLWAAAEGDPMCNGNVALKDAGYRAPADTTLVSRYRRAGLVMVGRTNTPELGILPTTEPLAFGPTAQPVGHHPDAGRLVGWVGGRRRRRPRTGGPRLRRGRLHPDPGRRSAASSG